MNFIEELGAYAVSLAGELGYPYHVERSHPTESVYVRVMRDGHWFGLRISAHDPAYDCSADFQQLMVPEQAAGEELQQSARREIDRFVQSCGRVVADPFEVQEAIQEAFLEARSGGRRRFPTTTEVCTIRHRLNIRASWSYDVERG